MFFLPIYFEVFCPFLAAITWKLANMFFKSWGSVQQTWKKLLKPQNLQRKLKDKTKFCKKNKRGAWKMSLLYNWAQSVANTFRLRNHMAWIWRRRGRNPPCFCQCSDYWSKYRSCSSRYISKAQWFHLCMYLLCAFVLSEKDYDASSSVIYNLYGSEQDVNPVVFTSCWERQSLIVLLYLKTMTVGIPKSFYFVVHVLLTNPR